MKHPGKTTWHCSVHSKTLTGCATLLQDGDIFIQDLHPQVQPPDPTTSEKFVKDMSCQGCAFYFSQAIWRKVQDFGLIMLPLMQKMTSHTSWWHCLSFPPSMWKDFTRTWIVKHQRAPVRIRCIISTSPEWQGTGCPRIGLCTDTASAQTMMWRGGPLTRNVKLRVAHALGMLGTFFPPPWVSDPDMHNECRDR